MSIKAILFVFACGISGAAMAQGAKSVSPYADWMQTCIAQEEQLQPDGTFGSSIERGFSKAICQCHFDHLPASGTMTRDQFSAAFTTCFQERKTDPVNFSLKYLERSQQISLTATTAPKRGATSGGDRWRTVGKNSQVRVEISYDTQSVKKVGNAIYVVAKFVRPDASKMFARAELSCNTKQISFSHKVEMDSSGKVTSNEATAGTEAETKNIRPGSIVEGLYDELCTISSYGSESSRMAGQSGTDDKLLAHKYAAAIQAAVSAGWARPESVPLGSKCHVVIKQLPGGGVIDAQVQPGCSWGQAGQDSLERAVLKAQPLPYRGFESVFNRQINFNFTAE